MPTKAGWHRRQLSLTECLMYVMMDTTVPTWIRGGIAHVLAGSQASSFLQIWFVYPEIKGVGRERCKKEMKVNVVKPRESKTKSKKRCLCLKTFRVNCRRRLERELEQPWTRVGADKTLQQPSRNWHPDWFVPASARNSVLFVLLSNACRCFGNRSRRVGENKGEQLASR